jgi:hypothetical protein
MCFDPEVIGQTLIGGSQGVTEEEVGEGGISGFSRITEANLRQIGASPLASYQPTHEGLVQYVEDQLRAGVGEREVYRQLTGGSEDFDQAKSAFISQVQGARGARSNLTIAQHSALGTTGTATSRLGVSGLQDIQRRARASLKIGVNG